MKFAYRFITLAALGLVIHFNSLELGSSALASAANPPAPTIPSTPRASAQEPKVLSTTPDTSKTKVNTSGVPDSEKQANASNANNSIVLTAQKSSGPVTVVFKNNDDPNMPKVVASTPWVIDDQVRGVKLNVVSSKVHDELTGKDFVKISVGALTEAGVPGVNCVCEKLFSTSTKYDDVNALVKISEISDFLVASAKEIKTRQDVIIAEEKRKEEKCEYPDDNKKLISCLNNKVKIAKPSEKSEAQDNLSEALQQLLSDADDEAKFKEARELFKSSKANLSSTGKTYVQNSMTKSLEQLITNATDDKALSSISKLVKETVPLFTQQQKSELAQVLTPRLSENIAREFFNKFQTEVKRDFDSALIDLDRAGNDYVSRQRALVKLGEAEKKLQSFLEKQDRKSFGDLNAKVNNIFGGRGSSDTAKIWDQQIAAVERDYKDIKASNSSHMAQVVDRIRNEDFDSSYTTSSSSSTVARQDSSSRTTFASRTSSTDTTTWNTRLSERAPKGVNDFLVNPTILPGLSSPVGTYSNTYRALDQAMLGKYGQNGSQFLNTNPQAVRNNNTITQSSTGRGGRTASTDSLNDIPQW